MKNPWEIVDAFDPMFDESIEIITDNCNLTLECAVFADATGDALSPDLVETNRIDINIVVRKNDWPVLENVHTNNIVKRTVAGKVVTYAVTDLVDDAAIGKLIKARSTDISDD